jgi:hypothetical protein
MKENKFELNHTYLINKSTRTIMSVTILLITDKSYHVQWNNDIDNSTSWELKILFEEYNIVEDITNFISNKTFYEKICDAMSHLWGSRYCSRRIFKCM